MARPLVQAFSTRNLFTASTVDQMPKHVSSGLLFGNPGAIPVPDLDRTGYLLMLGANPHESNGSLCTAPDFPGRMAAIRERGGKVVVVDPRTTRSAEAADEHLAIRPGTDALWMAALANVVLADGADLGSIADLVDGLDELTGALARFTPEAVAGACRIDADTTRRIARELVAAPSAAVYGRIGTHTVRFGTLASWICDVLNVVTGNLDAPGGAMFPRAAMSAPDTGKPPGGRGFRTGRWTSRVGGHPEVRGELPTAALAEEILEPGEGQVRALVTLAGNPVRSNQDSATLERALGRLDFMVSVDIYLNETTRHADVILPAPSALEKEHFDLAFHGLSIRNVVNWSPAVLDHDGPDEFEILARLILIAHGQPADADPAIVYDLMLGELAATACKLEDGPFGGHDAAEILAPTVGRPFAERLVDVMCRTGAYGVGIDELAAAPHGIDFGPLEPNLRRVLRTEDGRVHLLPDAIADDLPRLAASLDDDTGGLLLVGRRDLRSNNSWMHNVEVLVKGKSRCTLHVHPTDAARLGLDGSADATVTSRTGSIVAPVEVTDRVSPGVVSLPHGWGHDSEGARLGVAARYAGVNSNVLTDPSVIDPLSGNGQLNAIPVEVAPATAR
jgi:anaerobic selenocysteine-containing dehydrogenase